MSLINVSNLTFCYDGSYDNIIEDVSFQIDTDWKLGFTGRNGRGKTTFLQLLLGNYEYSGTISSTAEFDYFPFDIADKTQLTADVLVNICGCDLWELKKELSLLEVSEEVLYRPFETLSNGEQTKVLLAALFLKENNFLLIDEPTNHLDINARKAVSNYLKTKKGFILVSHDRAFLDNCIDHILSINKTNIEIQKGNFSSWWMNKENQDNFEVNENIKLHKEIRKLEIAAKRTAQWSEQVEKSKMGGAPCDRGYIGHKAAKMMKRSKSIEARQHKAIEEKSILLRNIEASERLSISPAEYQKSNLIGVKNLSLFYGNKQVCSDVSFDINRGERLAVIGRNGCGKSSIIKLLLGQEIAYSGRVEIGSNLIVSYVSQDTSFLCGSLKSFSRNSGIDETLFKAILRKLDFSRAQFDKDMQDYSEGQKKKVLIARSLCERAHLYIWDEPLNFIDIVSRIQIEELIIKHQPTMLFVEHDSAFVEMVATKHVSI